MSEDLEITPHLRIPGAELSWTAVRSGGPGGQNVNKVATKVELRFVLSQSQVLPDQVKQRLARLSRGRLDAEGAIVITADETRSQRRNLELARERLSLLIRAALVAPKRRRATKPSAAARRRRVEAKRRTGEKKRTRTRGEWE